MEAYPDVKVVLTVRDPVKWHNSVKNTIHKVGKMWNNDYTVVLFANLVGLWKATDCVVNVCKG